MRKKNEIFREWYAAYQMLLFLICQ